MHAFTFYCPANDRSITTLASCSKCCTTGGIPTIRAELTSRATAAGVTIDYAPGCNNASCLTTSGFAAAATAASTADAVILVLGMGQTQFNCNGDRDRTACESESYDRYVCVRVGVSESESHDKCV